MGLIYTNSYNPDVGIFEEGYLNDCSVDIEIGTVLSEARNDAEFIVRMQDNTIRKGCLIYDESGSEVGGYVYGIKVNTSSNEVTLKCKLWRGMLMDHIIRPPASEDYFVFDGDANDVLSAMLGDGYDGLIVASKKKSGIYISGKARYQDILSVYENALANVGAKINITFYGNKAICEAVPIRDLSEEIHIDNDYGIPISAEDCDNGYNHIIALGQGELKERQVYELWMMPNGVITDDTKLEKPSGIALRTFVYDYPSAESYDELKKGAFDKLLEISPSKKLEIEQGNIDAEVGDIVSAEERITGIYMKKQITRKIIKGDIKNGVYFLKTELKVGD